MAPEFSLAVALDRLSAAPSAYRVEPGPAARAALAERLGLEAIDRLVADLLVRRTPAGAEATGTLEAAVTQTCIVSGEAVRARIEEPVAIRFEPLPDAADLELDAAALDCFPLEAGRIDLGEAVVELLAAALDPWPRAGEEALSAARRLLLSEEEAAAQAPAGPFALLAKGSAQPGSPSRDT